MLSMIVGIFCVHTSTYGATTPCLYYNGIGSYPSDDFAAGSGAPFFIALQKLNSISAMRSRNESSSNGQITPKSNRVAHVTSRTKTPGGATSVPTISVYVTGTRNNPYLYAIRKAFYELLLEVSQGHVFAELRFVKKCEAAALLYPEHRKMLKGKTVTIKTR
jgi:hypothetical protein